jgi:hypothetical protein
MKFYKIPGLIALAATALMASAGAASATTVTTSAGETPSIINASSEGHVVLHNQFGTIECSMVAQTRVENHGSGIPASGKLAPFFSCTNGWSVKNAAATPLGTLSVTALGGGSGTLTSSGSTVEAISPFGNICRYLTNNTHVGTATVEAEPEEEALTTVHIEAEIPFHGGSPLCGEEPAPLTGSLKVTLPEILGIH